MSEGNRIHRFNNANAYLSNVCALPERRRNGNLNLREQFGAAVDVYAGMLRRNRRIIFQEKDNTQRETEAVSRRMLEREEIKRRREESGVRDKTDDTDPNTRLKGYDIDSDVLNMLHAPVEKKEEVAREVKNNLESMIYEILGSPKMPTYQYPIVNGQIYSTALNQAFYDMFKYGVEVQKKRGSQAVRREMLEVEESKAQDELFREPGIMRVVLSPPYAHYTNKYIDIRISKKDKKTGKLYIESTRHEDKKLTLEDYGKIAKLLQPNYSEKFEKERSNPGFMHNILIEEYYPGRGITVSEQIKGQYGSTPDKLYRKLLGEINPKEHIKIQSIVEQCKDLIDGYATILKTSLFNKGEDWRNLGKTFQSILAYSEALFKGDTSIIQRTSTWIREKSEAFISTTQHLAAAFMRKIEYLSTQIVSKITNGCGFYLGMEIKENANPIFRLMNFLAPIGLHNKDLKTNKENLYKKTKQEQEWFSCPSCGWEADGPIGNGPCGGCGLTFEKYKLENPKKICA